MLCQFIVYGTFGAVCIEDDSELGAMIQALELCDDPQCERVTAIKRVNIMTYGYPY